MGFQRNLFQKDFGAEQAISNAHLINSRRVINGQDDGLMQLSPLKHPWAQEAFNIMVKNTWVPQEIGMQTDVGQWQAPEALTTRERRVYERCLAFVSNLDGLQTNNLSCNIIRHITSPEIILAITRQTYEEALHVQSYATMIEALGLDPNDIYGMYRKDKDLYEKNQTVLKAVSKIADPLFKTGTFENDQLFLEACIGNIILEGIYFYSAFLVFYVFKRHGKMPGSAEMIQFINRDEDMHLHLFIQITQTIKKEQPELWTPNFQKRIRQNVIDGVQMEYRWGQACIGEGILGLTPGNLNAYLEFVGDQRLASIGLEKFWGSANPFPWIDELTQSNMIEVNFFEGRVKEYQTGSLEW